MITPAPRCLGLAMVGPPAVGRSTTLRALVAEVGFGIIEVNLTELARVESQGEFEIKLATIGREAMLLGCVVLLSADALWEDGGEAAQRLAALAPRGEELPGLLLDFGGVPLEAGRAKPVGHGLELLKMGRLSTGLPIARSCRPSPSKSPALTTSVPKFSHHPAKSSQKAMGAPGNVPVSMLIPYATPPCC